MKLESFVKTFVNLCIIFASIFFVLSCATMGSPDGGPKDKSAPVIKEIYPENLSTNFNAKTVEIQFDEYVKLNKLNEQLFISPPINADLDVRIKGKGIIFDIPIDSLLENTTYSIQFGNAVVDVNENNPYPNLNYIFSTGDKLDSLAISGNIIDAWTSVASKKPYVVWLFRSVNDSALFKLQPNYVSNADASGNFEITHISPGIYSVYGFEDVNGNSKYDGTEEALAFLDSVITLTGSSFSTVVDTVKSDSLNAKAKVYGYNVNLRGSVVKSKESNQRLLSKQITDRRQIELIFQNPNIETPSIEMLGNNISDNWGLLDATQNNDTINIWLADSTLIKSDTVSLIYSMAYSEDSTIADTLLFRNPRVRKKDKTEAVYAEKKMSFKASISDGTSIKHTSKVQWLFDTPIQKVETHLITGFVLKDTLWIPIETKWEKDEFNARKIYFTGPFKPERTYKIELDSGFITNIYDQVLEQQVIQFSTYSLENYGNLTLSIKGIKSQMILQLLNEKDRVLKSQILNADETIYYPFLDPGKYRFRLIEDINKNGAWDPGNLIEKVQPEKVYYYNLPQDIRENWDLNQEWLFNR